ncbi:hypothetical protein M1403_03145 [Patescibacteria group bacterium]|nr:hypothetical protein [Patescibacteria group bacterium]
MAAKETKLSLDEVIKTMGEWFAKLPNLPANVREILVKIAPWLALIFGILGILGSIAATGFLTALSPFIALGGGVGLAAGSIVGAVLALGSSVLMVMAFPGLRDRKMSGWKLLFGSELVSVIASVVALNLIGAIVGALIGFYLLYQVKSYYK